MLRGADIQGLQVIIVPERFIAVSSTDITPVWHWLWPLFAMLGLSVWRWRKPVTRQMADDDAYVIGNKIHLTHGQYNILQDRFLVD